MSVESAVCDCGRSLAHGKIGVLRHRAFVCEQHLAEVNSAVRLRVIPRRIGKRIRANITDIVAEDNVGQPATAVECALAYADGILRRGKPAAECGGRGRDNICAFSIHQHIVLTDIHRIIITDRDGLQIGTAVEYAEAD